MLGFLATLAPQITNRSESLPIPWPYTLYTLLLLTLVAMNIISEVYLYSVCYSNLCLPNIPLHFGQEAAVYPG